MRVGTVLILVGVGLALIGVVLRFFPGLFSWFGNLPGDIRHQSNGVQVLIPITSMLIVSVVASLLWNLLSRFFRGE
jgi:hypothetical protein